MFEFIVIIIVIVRILILLAEVINQVSTTEELNNYTRKNKLKSILKNTKAEWRLVRKGVGSYYIVCKEYHNNKKIGRLLTISTKSKFNINIISALWCCIQMKIKSFSTFKKYDKKSFNRTVYTNYDNVIFKYEEEKIYPEINNEAQNENCRIIYNPKDNVICVIEIWEKQPEKFFITGDKKALQGLIKEAPYYLKPFTTFIELLEDFQSMPEFEVQYTPMLRPQTMKDTENDLPCSQQKNKKKSKKRTKKERNKEKLQEIKQIKIEEVKEKIDINNADLESIRKLPGINVVIAKRILNKREEINGFKSVQEVLDFINLSQHMSKTLQEQICVNPIKISPVKIKYDEVNIDL